MKEVIYIKTELQTTIYKREVLLEDICEVTCRNEALRQQILKRSLYEFHDVKDKKVCKRVFSVLDIIDKLQVVVPDDNFVFLGESDILVEYQPGHQPGKLFTIFKTVVICILIFFGAAFTIMAFNNDISIDGVFEHFYYQMTGQKKPQFSELEVAYSLGLAVGIVVFFNHFGKHKLTDDVTPIEVEINKHQQDTYNTIIEKSKNAHSDNQKV